MAGSHSASRTKDQRRRAPVKANRDAPQSRSDHHPFQRGSSPSLNTGRLHDAFAARDCVASSADLTRSTASPSSRNNSQKRPRTAYSPRPQRHDESFHPDSLRSHSPSFHSRRKPDSISPPPQHSLSNSRFERRETLDRAGLDPRNDRQSPSSAGPHSHDQSASRFPQPPAREQDSRDSSQLRRFDCDPSSPRQLSSNSQHLPPYLERTQYNRGRSASPDARSRFDPGPHNPGDSRSSYEGRHQRARSPSRNTGDWRQQGSDRNARQPQRSPSRSPGRERPRKKRRGKTSRDSGAQEREREQEDRKGRGYREMSYPYDAPYGGRGPPPRGRGSVPPQYGIEGPGYSAPPHSASPYSAGSHPGWGPDPYSNSQSPGGYGHNGPGPYTYPSAGSPHAYSPGPPPQSYGGHHSGYPPQGHPPPYDRHNSYEGRGGYDRRGRGGYSHPSERNHSGTGPTDNFDRPSTFDAARGARRGRGHFTNLSWTPKEGRRGGHHVPTKRDRDDGDSRRSEPDDDGPQDDLFRPPQDFRAEDQTSQDASAMPPPVTESKTKAALGQALDTHSMPEATTIRAPTEERLGVESPKSKLQSIKDRLNGQLAQKAQAGGYQAPPPKKRAVKVMRYKSVLPEEYQNSESVYYRKPGNESVIGSGTYGKVYRATHVYTRHQVALKKVRMEGERDGFPITAMREIKIIQYLRHENVVALHEIMVEKNDCYMVFEYLSHDLTGLLNHPSYRLAEGQKKNLSQQLMRGIDYMHQKAVLHRDLKAANILISSQGVLKLADFGLARQYDKRRKMDYTNRVITIWYRPPELLLGETQYGPAVDIWSAACVLVEIFTRHSLFPGEGNEIAQLDKIYSIMGTPTKTEWPDVAELPWYELLRPATRIASTFQAKYTDKVSTEAFALLQQMLSYDPKNRPSAEEVLAHSYFTEEEPREAPLTDLADIEGEWHEFESKKLRKEGEEKRRQEEKRKRHEAAAEADREAKKVKMDSDGSAPMEVTSPSPE